jgi:ABC-type branched-subunit amino acid transport system ATPase component
MEVLGRLGLQALAARRAGQLSYGQQRLLEFGTTLMAQPRLVLLDEPTAGVNPVMIDILEAHIRRLRSEGVAFLLVEHQLDLVMRLCDTVVVLGRGVPIAMGTPDEVSLDPMVLDAYLGG